MSTTKVLQRDDIIRSNDIALERVYVKEWAGDLFVRVMSGADRDKFEELHKNSTRIYRAPLIASTVCDEKGNLLFTPEDVKKLGTKNANALTTVAEAALKINGLTDAELDEQVKNSGSGPSGDSGTG